MRTKPRRAAEGDGLFVLGLIGQAGSGKSSVARTLERDGASVIDADALGHVVVNRDPEVRAALSSEYGAGVYGPTGLDRARVAEVVFRDAAALARLNSLVHPRIVERIRARLDELRAADVRGVVVVDAALLLDWGFERECDAVLAVTAPRAAQLERLAAQRGWSAAQAESLLAAQRPAVELAAAADMTIDNHGHPEQLERSARQALEQLREARANQKGHDGSPC
jgi:dephospho-CoA kinase